VNVSLYVINFIRGSGQVTLHVFIETKIVMTCSGAKQRHGYFRPLKEMACGLSSNSSNFVNANGPNMCLSRLKRGYIETD